MPENQNAGIRLWNKYFIFACLIFLITGLSMNMLNSTLAVYVYSLFGNAAFSGYLNAAFAVLAILARMIAGYVCDRYGRQIVIITGSVIFGVSVLVFGFFPIPALLVIFRGLQGFGYSASSTATTAMGADVLPPRRLGEGIGYLGLGFSVSSAVGAVFALSLVRGDDYGMVYYVTAFILLAGVILAFFCDYERKPEYMAKIAAETAAYAKPEGENSSLISRYVEYKALPATLVQLFACTAWAFISSFLILYASFRGYANIGLFFTISAISMTGTRFFSGRLADKYGVLAVAIPAMLMGVAAFVLLWLAQSEFLFYLCGLLSGLFIGTLSPVFNTEAIRASPANRRGAASGTFQIANDVANGLGAVIWGLIIDFSGYNAAFIGCIVTIVISLFLSLVFFGKKRPAAAAKY